jgi:hypothetical protein
MNGARKPAARTEIDVHVLLFMKCMAFGIQGSVWVMRVFRKFVLPVSKCLILSVNDNFPRNGTGVEIDSSSVDGYPGPGGFYAGDLHWI